MYLRQKYCTIFEKGQAVIMCNNKLEINDAEKIILQGLKLLDEKNYSEAAEIINKAYETFKQENYLEGISISLSLIAFLKYTENEYDYEQSIALAKDGKIKGVGVAHNKSTEYLKSIPDGSEMNNLSSLPTVKNTSR